MSDHTCPRCCLETGSPSRHLCCNSCKTTIHMTCLQTPLPTPLLSDTLFILECSSCSSTKTDTLQRSRMSWLNVTLLALYNLHLNENYQSRYGYFHWRLDICEFISEHWAVIWGASIKKKKTWTGTVSGSLSGHVGVLFESGVQHLGEPGWWRLISLDPVCEQVDRLVSLPRSSVSASLAPPGPVTAPTLLGKRSSRLSLGSSYSSIANAIALKQKRDMLTDLARKPRTVGQDKNRRPGRPSKVSRGKAEATEAIHNVHVVGATILKREAPRKPIRAHDTSNLATGQYNENYLIQSTKPPSLVLDQLSPSVSGCKLSSLPPGTSLLYKVIKPTSVDSNLLQKSNNQVPAGSTLLHFKKSVPKPAWYQVVSSASLTPSPNLPDRLFTQDDEDDEYMEGGVINNSQGGCGDVAPEFVQEVELELGGVIENGIDNNIVDDNLGKKESFHTVKELENKTLYQKSFNTNKEDIVSQVTKEVDLKDELDLNDFIDETSVEEENVVDAIVSGGPLPELSELVGDVAIMGQCDTGDVAMVGHCDTGDVAIMKQYDTGDVTMVRQCDTRDVSMGQCNTEDVAITGQCDMEDVAITGQCDTEDVAIVRQYDTSDVALVEKSNIRDMAIVGQCNTKDIQWDAYQKNYSLDDLKNAPSLLTEWEENKVLSSLHGKSDLLNTNLVARQLYRKLQLRKLLRGKGMPVFDLDKEANSLIGLPKKKDEILVTEPGVGRVLDRFLGSRIIDGKSLLVSRAPYTKCVLSPYTGRKLKPYIRQDADNVPPKLQILRDIQQRRPSQENACSHPIDYCYVQPSHIPAVNQLARQSFWPDIELSEVLQYPDFSCVVLYKRLVIGFAVVVPDVKHNEAYLSFLLTHPEWRRSGIATFMLYHIIQTCMGKDITLHVSANNPAMLLYQKFGFKVEEVVNDFYDKYLPPDSKECKHALFLRLHR